MVETGITVMAAVADWLRMENLHVHNLLDNAGIVLLQEVQKASGNDVHYMVEQITGYSESNAIFAGKKTSTQQDWIGQVNTMLTASASRLEGLCLLRAIVGQCSEETFLKHSVTWSRLLISFFQPHQSPPVIEASAAILIEVFRWASQLPDVARELATGHIPAFLKTLVDCDAEWTAPSLRLLSACMRCFPGPCATVSYILEDFIIMHLTNGLPHLARLSQQCLPLLARLGGGGSGGVKHREAFLELVNRLLHTLRMKLADLYADFYGDLDDPKSSNSNVEPLRLPKVPAEEPKRTFQLTNHIETLCCCLQYMLSEHFPEGTMVPLKDILDFISKALDVTCNSVASHVTMENSMLAFVIPRIHQAAIQTLTSVIKSCCANHYNDRINQMYINVLGWTNEKRLHFSALRSTTYSSIVQWLEAAGASSGLAEQAGDKLVGWCINDASPVSVTTKLAASVQMKSDKKGGKLKVKGQTGESKEDPPLRETMVYASQRLCVAALKALWHLVLTGGMKLKTNSYEDMSKFVTAQLVRIQNSSSEELSAPYSDSDCRRWLYRVLLAGVLVPHPQASSVTKLAVGIFRKGKNDASLKMVFPRRLGGKISKKKENKSKVSSTCTEAALICSAIIHPRTPAVPRPSASPLLLTLGSSMEAATPQTPAAVVPLSKFKEPTGTVRIRNCNYFWRRNGGGGEEQRF
ncbi:proline-, glutamic acid- and leucine-rich protein 1-like [Diadema setosum]|uniref:proline-, glutamic acid- and leucine-rich protein 1-like n=1 Tax=Diadema setosum TaxID=31175 RepID=UPI003B3A2D6F